MYLNFKLLVKLDKKNRFQHKVLKLYLENLRIKRTEQIIIPMISKDMQ